MAGAEQRRGNKEENRGGRLFVLASPLRRGVGEDPPISHHSSVMALTILHHNLWVPVLWSSGV